MVGTGHTLIGTRDVGRELSAKAFELTTGVPMREQAKMTGSPNRSSSARPPSHGIASREDFDRFAAALDGQYLQDCQLRDADTH
ncbi:hypothetical protein GCM10010245_82710 [Streptomyces spectabilis]|nr:hypothetical protein GCM10010245_82710 [Streptomyces spectabilis]